MRSFIWIVPGPICHEEFASMFASGGPYAIARMCRYACAHGLQAAIDRATRGRLRQADVLRGVVCTGIGTVSTVRRRSRREATRIQSIPPADDGEG